MKWPTVALGDVCDVIAGGTPKRSVSSYWGGEIPWVKISDMLQGEIRSTDECITTDGLKNCSAKLLPPRTTLISIFATIGRTATLAMEATTNQAIVGVIPKRQDTFFTPFLRYCLDDRATYLKRLSRGVAQNNINGAVLKSTLVPLPPLAEQKRIAAILDAADALRAKRRESLAQLDALLQSTFLEMFGDPVTNPKGWESVSGDDSPFGYIEDLSNVADVIDCKHRTPVYTDEGYPVVRPRDVREEGISFDNCVKTTAEELADLTEKRLPSRGDIIYSRNATFGVASLVTTSEQFAIGQDVCLIVPRTLNSVFLYYLLNSHFVRRQLGLATSGSTFKRINLSAIRKLKILVPPQVLQEKFESIFTKHRQLCKQLHRSKAELDVLFASLQHRAFNGELSPSHSTNMPVAKSDYDKKPDTTDPVEKSATARPIEEYDTNEVMAVLRQVFRGKTRLDREELLKDLSLELGYARLGPKARTILSGHVIAAQRRHILTSEGDTLCMERTSIADYTRDELVETVISVTNMNCIYTREELIYAVSDHLGFRRVTDGTRDTMKSTINAALRRNIVEHYDNESVKRIG
jgi:type I restriction enzyme, S subunit